MEGDATHQTLVLTPVQRAICQAWDAGWMTLVIAGSVQSGKTLLGVVVPALYQIAEDCRPVMIAGPKVDDPAAIWRAKAEPILRASGLGDLLPQDGGGSRRGTPEEFLTSRGCRVYLRGAGGANESQQALATVRAVRLTYVGELGWELHVPTEQAVHVYELLKTAGARLGVMPRNGAGYWSIIYVVLDHF
jgi:hypothetical protein